MSCDPPMNQNEIIASISFYKNKRLIVSYYNEQHLFIPCLFEFFSLFAPIIAMKDKQCFYLTYILVYLRS